MRALLALYQRKDRDAVIAEAQAGFEPYDYNEPEVAHG